MSDVQIEITDDISDVLKKYKDFLNITDDECEAWSHYILILITTSKDVWRIK